jgi:hypothetical protein
MAVAFTAHSALAGVVAGITTAGPTTSAARLATNV